MSIFALNKIESIDSKQRIDKLLMDEVCLFDEFEKEIQSNPQYLSELGSIYNYIEYVGNGNSVPQKHFKDITPKKEKVKEYEFKSNNLRVYAIKQENGKIIVMGGYKNSQKKDIIQFRSIKRQYLEFTKQNSR